MSRLLSNEITENAKSDSTILSLQKGVCLALLLEKLATLRFLFLFLLNESSRRSDIFGLLYVGSLFMCC